MRETRATSERGAQPLLSIPIHTNFNSRSIFFLRQSTRLGSKTKNPNRISYLHNHKTRILIFPFVKERTLNSEGTGFRNFYPIEAIQIRGNDVRLVLKPKPPWFGLIDDFCVTTVGWQGGRGRQWLVALPLSLSVWFCISSLFLNSLVRSSVALKLVNIVDSVYDFVLNNAFPLYNSGVFAGLCFYLCCYLLAEKALNHAEKAISIAEEAVILAEKALILVGKASFQAEKAMNLSLSAYSEDTTQDYHICGNFLTIGLVRLSVWNFKRMKSMKPPE